MTPVAVGVDLGGTNLRVAVLRDGALAQQHRELVGDERAPEAIAARIARAVEALGVPGAPVGVGFAAMMRTDAAGTVAVSPHFGWREVPLGTLLRAALPGRHIVVANDVNAVTWGELRAGAGRGARELLAVFVGTGIGGGLVCNGQLVVGGSGVAAEIGHVKVAFGPEARPCNCGLRGCVEAYAGGTYLQARARAELAAGATSAATQLAGGPEHVHPGHLDEAARAGDVYALELWREAAGYLGVALANAVTLLDPEQLILGGGVLRRTPLLRELTVTALTQHANPPALADLTISDAALGDDAGIVGAALLALVS